MGKDKERIATGIHIVAAATLCSKGASRAELDLAAEILKRDPPRALPRELAGSLETFNRHMDAAIESCNESSGESTRAGRRARLASDLERAGLVLIESASLADLLTRQLAGVGDPFPDEDDGLDEGEDLGAELLEEMDLQRSIDETADQRYFADPLGLEGEPREYLPAHVLND